MKLPRISVGLDEHTLKMIEEMERVLVENRASFSPSEPHDENPRWRTWFCRWAIMAVARAVVEAGELPIPLGVDLRYETSEEREERCGISSSEIAALAAKYADYAPKETKQPGLPRFKWTPENLN